MTLDALRRVQMAAKYFAQFGHLVRHANRADLRLAIDVIASLDDTLRMRDEGVRVLQHQIESDALGPGAGSRRELVFRGVRLVVYEQLSWLLALADRCQLALLTHPWFARVHLMVALVWRELEHATCVWQRYGDKALRRADPRSRRGAREAGRVALHTVHLLARSGPLVRFLCEGMALIDEPVIPRSCELLLSALHAASEL